MKKKTHDQFIFEANVKKHPNIRIIGKYLGSDKKISVKCAECQTIRKNIT